MQQLVSIGMPVFNDRQFLRPALDALLTQSYTNFSLIISDDGSTDGSEAVCREYAARDPRIRYIRQPRTLGISKNMMFLLKEGKGDYFMWAANDDLWHPDFIKTLHDALRQNADAICAFTPMYFIDEHDKQITNPPPRATDYSAPTAYRRLKKLIRIFDDSFGYGLFRREEIANVRFPVWWWINKRRAYNNIYPTLCYYLAKGDFVLAGKVPMWYNRLKDEKNIHHKIPYNCSFIRGYLAFVLWKFNLVAVSLRQIARAGKGWVSFRIFPSMFFCWMIVPARDELISRISLLRKKKISFF